jgi:transcriptional regulator with XRE-family HTH domain
MDNVTQQLLNEEINISTCVGNVVQKLAQKIDMSFDEFVGEMRKRGCSEPTAIKIWRGDYENYKNFNDNNISLSNLRKAADVLKIGIEKLFPKIFVE